MSNFDVQLSDEGKTILQRLIQAMSRTELYDGLMKVFGKLAQRAAGWIVKTQLSGQALHRRTGMLARSIVGRAEMRQGVPAFRVGIFRGPALKYAGIMEHGTRGMNPESPFKTIRPTHARALAFPVEDGLTPAGVARYDGPRNYPGQLTFVPYPRGRKAIGGLYDKQTLRAAPDLRQARRVYVLLRQLDLPPHWYLRNGLRTFVPQVLTELMTFLRDLLAAVNARNAAGAGHAP